MGMSSSQARLLSLTARQHDVEWRAQKLQAEKLQLANDSDRVYNNYLNQLNATKIQTRIYDEYNGDTFMDATLAMLENGAIPKNNAAYKDGTYAAEPLFLQEISTGRLMITPEYAKSLGLTADSNTYTGTIDEFLIEKGFTKDKEIVTKVPTGNYIEDPTVTTGFKPVSNSGYTEYQYNYTYEGAVDNAAGGIDYEALKGYAEFNSNHTASTAGTAVSNVSSFASGQTYTINNANDLKKLMDLTTSGQSTSGVNFVLTADIDMGSISGWTGIKDFAGTFDGNGYKISNLSGTNGLFTSTDNATIKNVGLENININGNSAYVGGLIGYAKNTNITNSYTTGTVHNSNRTAHGDLTQTGGANIGTGGLVGGINVSGSDESYTYDNIYSSANVDGYDNVGGLIGSLCSRNADPNISNAYAVGNVSGNNNVGGFSGHMYNDQDTTGKNTDITNAYAGGNVTGKDKVGGFFGNYLYWGDLDDHCEIRDCQSTGKVNGATSNEGAFAGHIYIKITGTVNAEEDKYVNFINCGYANNTGAANAYGNIVDTNGNNVNELVQNSGSTSGLTEFQVAAKIPTINADGTGGYYSNIYAAMVKAGAFDPANATETEKNELKNQITSFLNRFANSDADNKKLYFLNEKLYSYLTGADDAAFADALVADITNGTTNETAAWQTGTDPGTIKRDTLETTWEPTLHETSGQLTIPHINSIKQNIISAFKMADLNLYDTLVENFIAQYDLTDKNDLASLAYINDIVTNYVDNGGSIKELSEAVYYNTKITDIPDYIDDVNHYNITMSGTDLSSTIENSETHLRIPEYTNNITYEWDWNDPNIQQAVAEWKGLQGGYIIIGDATPSTEYDSLNIHLDSDWLTNVIQSGIAQFVRLDSVTGEMTGTSVANETSLQEVQNEAYLKQAEATYEKDMKKINKKETKIDTELEKLEAERSSIKTEQDDLKTVINDNVNLTFKLFS